MCISSFKIKATQSYYLSMWNVTELYKYNIGPKVVFAKTNEHIIFIFDTLNIEYNKASNNVCVTLRHRTVWTH